MCADDPLHVSAKACVCVACEVYSSMGGGTVSLFVIIVCKSVCAGQFPQVCVEGNEM